MILNSLALQDYCTKLYSTKKYHSYVNWQGDGTLMFQAVSVTAREKSRASSQERAAVCDLYSDRGHFKLFLHRHRMSLHFLKGCVSFFQEEVGTNPERICAPRTSEACFYSFPSFQRKVHIFISVWEWMFVCACRCVCMCAKTCKIHITTCLWS